jgi:hypothetical protein
MELLQVIWEFINSPAGAGLGFGLWVISEALASIPSVQANSVFQLFRGILTKFKKPEVVPVVLFAIVMSACSALPTLSKIAPTICAFATSDEAKQAALALINQMPDGPDKDKAMLALPVAQLSGDAACTFVKALESQQAIR